MTGTGKRKRRSNSIDNSDIDSSVSRTRQPGDLRRSKTTDDLSSTTPDPTFNPIRRDTTTTVDTQDANSDASRIRRDRTVSDPISLRQRQINDAQRSKTTDDLDTTVRRDSVLESTLTSVGGDSIPVQRQRSLSDLAATIDMDATIADLRSLRARSLSEGDDVSLFNPKPFDESSLSDLLDSMDQTDVSASPLLREASLNDANDDADDENLIEEKVGDLDVSVRRSSYSQDEENWRPLLQEADNALRALQAELTSVDDLPPFSPERYLAELLPNIYAQNGQGVSREILNDVYFLAKEHIDLTLNNPLLNSLTEEASRRIERMVELVNAIDKIEGRQAFLIPAEAQTYNAYKLSKTNLGASRLSAYDLGILQTYFGNTLTGISFSRTPENSGTYQTISDYRRSMINRLETDLDALNAVFKGKWIKKEHHKQVLDAEAALRGAIDRIKPLLDSPSDAITQEAEDQLNLAINSIRTIAQNYINSGDPKARNQDRINACQRVLDRLDQLLITDDNIASSRLNQSTITLDQVRLNILSALGPEKGRLAIEQIENLLFNASPDANPQTILDQLNMALDQAKVNNAAVASAVLGSITNPTAIVGDVAYLYNLYQDFKNKGGGYTQERVLKGGLAAANLTKNAASGISTGIETAKKFTEVSTAASTAATATGGIAGAVGTVIGAGMVAQGGLAYYKTDLRVPAAKDIGDKKIREQVLDRINTKKRRALLKAVGGAVAVIGGVVAIVAVAGVTMGAAVPVIAGIGALIGVGLTGERLGRFAYKSQQGTKGSQREELSTEIFVHMNDLLASGNYNKAKELAQALTNNKFKQNLMLRGADAGASLKDQQAALEIMRTKLKTW